MKKMRLMFNMIDGVEVDSTLSKDNQVYLIIDEKEYPTILSQIAIINYIELITDNDVILFLLCWK